MGFREESHAERQQTKRKIHSPSLSSQPVDDAPNVVYPSPELFGDFAKPGAGLGACQKACLGNLDSGLSRRYLRVRRPKLGKSTKVVTAYPGEKAVAPPSQQSSHVK